MLSTLSHFNANRLQSLLELAFPDETREPSKSMFIMSDEPPLCFTIEIDQHCSDVTLDTFD